MKRESAAKWVTIALLAGVAGAVMWREDAVPELTAPGSAAQEPPGPEATVYEMLDAARDGDVEAYLSSYGGSMARSLRQTVTEMTEPEFAASLRKRNSLLKGVAVMEPQRISELEAKARVEYVYADRNEAQTMYFENSGGKWRIARVEGAQPVTAPVPYGTPVK